MLLVLIAAPFQLFWLIRISNPFFIASRFFQACPGHGGRILPSLEKSFIL
jgi:hypothetical protein